MHELILEHDGARIPFSLKRSARKTVGIRIEPDASVTVTAPRDMSFDRILSLLRTKTGWMIRKCKEVRGRARAGERGGGRIAAFEDGGLFPYLGASIRFGSRTPLQAAEQAETA
jgi:predicted metal-dependent hydrolase